MKRPAHVELRVGPEQDTAGIKQEEVGTGYGRSQRAIDLRTSSPRDAAQNVLDRGGTIETRDIARADAELAETVELIIPLDRPAVDVIQVAGLRYRGTERAIGSDCRGDLRIGVRDHGAERVKRSAKHEGAHVAP